MPYPRLPLEAAQKFAMDNDAPDLALDQIGFVQERLTRLTRDIMALFADNAATF